MAFIAFYEDAAKVEAAAKARGFTGNDGESWHDFVEAEHDRFRCSRSFPGLQDAVDWLKGEVAETKSVYGAGNVVERVAVGQRCSACTCGGFHEIREYVVDDQGVADSKSLDSPCIED